MPAYFEIDFQYQKSDITESTVEDFFSLLTSCGLVYRSGFWHSENDNLTDILKWNQKKLQENLVLGYTEHYFHDYKQMLFNFCDFSEVRLIVNNFSDDQSFSFYLIIPEDDFVDYDKANGDERLVEKMEIIKNLAVQMWSQGKMNCIQTAWEGSDCVPDYKDIIKGMEPSIEPFAIVPDNTYCGTWNCSCEKTKRNGVLLKNDDNWFYI